MGIFYFLLVWREIKSKKFKKYFLLPTFNKFAIQNNPLMQLHLIFHKTLIKANRKSENLKVLVDLAAFQQLK